MYYTYILELTTKQLYVGHTYDLRKRLAEHNRGGVSATRNKRPLQLEFYASFKTKEKARVPGVSNRQGKVGFWRKRKQWLHLDSSWLIGKTYD